MVLKADQERLKALLSETVLLLCKNGLEFKSDFCIEALIGITVDQDDVFLISIKETVENELRAAQRAKEEAEKLALEAAQSPAPESPSRTHRKRKRKSPRPQSPSQDKNIKLETSGDRELDNNTSNTSFQDYNDESQHSRNMKFESGGAGDMGGDDEDNSNEIVFVKTENTDDQSLYGGPGQSSFIDSPYQSGMDSSQMSSSFQSPGAHSSHPGTSSWQSPMDSSQQGMSQNPLETQQIRRYLPKSSHSNRCRKCDVECSTRRLLHRHIQTVHIGRDYRCPHCDRTFTRSDSVKRHIERKNCRALHKPDEPDGYVDDKSDTNDSDSDSDSEGGGTDDSDTNTDDDTDDGEDEDVSTNNPTSSDDVIITKANLRRKAIGTLYLPVVKQEKDDSNQIAKMTKTCDATTRTSNVGPCVQQENTDNHTSKSSVARVSYVSKTSDDKDIDEEFGNIVYNSGVKEDSDSDDYDGHPLSSY